MKTYLFTMQVKLEADNRREAWQALEDHIGEAIHDSGWPGEYFDLTPIVCGQRWYIGGGLLRKEARE